MKEYIIEQLKSVKNQMNEDSFDFSKTDEWIDSMKPNELKKVRKEFVDVVSGKFEGGFRKYLQNKMMKTNKYIDVIKFVVRYMQDPSDENYNAVFELIGLPMLDYFVQKTFGKDSFMGRIKQITPFMKKVSTGNGKLDLAIYTALSESLELKEIRKEFEAGMKDVLDKKLDDVVSDPDFWDIFKKYGQPEGTDGVSENLQEVFGINRSIGNRLDRLKAAFSNKEVRNKFKILDGIMQYMPNLKPDLKRKVKERLFDLDYDDIADMVDRLNVSKAAKIATLPIMQNIIKNSQELYFGEASFKDFIELVEGVFLNKEVLVTVQRAVETFLRDMVRKAKEAQDKKGKLKTTKRKSYDL